MHSAPTLIATPLIACSRPQPMWTQRNAQPQGPDRPVGRRGGVQGKGTQAGCRAWTAPWRMGRVCEACLVWTPSPPAPTMMTQSQAWGAPCCRLACGSPAERI